MVGGTPVFVVCDGSLLVESNTVFTFVFDLHVFEMYRLVRLSLCCILVWSAPFPILLMAFSVLLTYISFSIVADHNHVLDLARSFEQSTISRDHSDCYISQQTVKDGLPRDQL